MDSDLAIALQLQEEFDKELVNSSDGRTADLTKPSQLVSPSRPLSIVDESWELTDPSPDVRALFLQFNDRYFWGKLAGVEVRWSPRMTLCAGLCCYEGRGGLCSIRLSTPLLQLRPRKDLVETLLHEMIHALLFVTDNNKDHDGHGPEFQKHMHRINKESGTNITIYHNFHDEVDHFKQHWWRCDGPCQTRKPYFGFVKRAMNRAPAPRDIWWAEHQRTCGGTYTKVKEPEGYGQKKKGKSSKKEDKESAIEKKNEKMKTGNMDIRIFAGAGFSLTSGGSLKNGNDNKLGKSESSVVRKPSATVTKSDIDEALPHLPDDYLPLSQRISHTDHTGKSLVNETTTNSLHRGKSLNPTHISQDDKTSPGVTSGGLQSPVPSHIPVSPSASKNLGASDKNKPFQGVGKVLGGTETSGSNSVLAMLRKKWSAEGATKTNPKTLQVPSSSNHNRKRNSDEFKAEGTSSFDFKKMKHITKSTGIDHTNDCENRTLNSLLRNHNPDNNHHVSDLHTKHKKSYECDNDVIVVPNKSENETKANTSCPVCQTLVDVAYINEHLDRCLAE